MANKKYDDAIKTFQKALDLMPDDKTASDLLASAQKAKTDDATATTAAQTQSQVQTLLKQGQTALAAGDIAGASKAFEAASKLSPQQADVLRFQQDLKKAQTEAALVVKKKEEEAKRIADFSRLMNQGAVAKTNKRYTEAVAAYRDALKIMPDDPKATAAMADAQKALDLSKTPPKPTPQEEYAKQMQLATAAENKRQWSEAVQAYQQALKFMPGDAKATAGQKNADYQKNMDDGRAALNAKQYQNAAKFFDAALRDKPGDPTASDLLKKAKAGK
jgi:tetratricopeptide (TPR) repeat protein